MWREFLNISAKQDIKAVAYMAQKPGEDGAKTQEQPVVVFLRGDQTVNETKLLTLVKGERTASDAGGRTRRNTSRAPPATSVQSA